MSRKIVRVFAVTEQEAPVEKVQHKELINEILGFGKKKNAEPEVPPEEDGDPGLKADGESSIQHVLGRIFSVPSDSVRCILFLNDADLKGRYLVSGGETKYSASLDEELLNLIQTETDNSVFVKVDGTFSLDDVTDSMQASSGYAVLLNVKKAVWAKFAAAKTLDEKKKTFADVIAHRYYVAVLNTNNIRKARVGPLMDPDEQLEKFNINTFITSYPQRSVIDAARQEYDEKIAAAPEKETSDDEAAIAAVVKRAVNFVMINLKGNKLKISRPSFEKSFSKIVDDAPEIKGREALKGEIIHAIANHPSIKKAKAHAILGDLVPAPDDAQEQTELTIPSGKSPEPIPDIDPEMGAEKIAATLAANPRLAKQVMATLSKYAI